MKSKIIWMIILTSIIFGFEVNTHQAITRCAITTDCNQLGAVNLKSFISDSFLRTVSYKNEHFQNEYNDKTYFNYASNGTGFKKWRIGFSSKFNYQDLIEAGVVLEDALYPHDDKIALDGDGRFNNHFYSAQKKLTQTSNMLTPRALGFGGYGMRTDNIDWALNEEVVLINLDTSLIPPNKITIKKRINKYGIEDAFNYFKKSFIGNTTDRHSNQAKLFLSLGYLIHMIQDLHSPAHVRNHSHPLGDYLEIYGRYNGGFNLVDGDMNIENNNPKIQEAIQNIDMKKSMLVNNQYSSYQDFFEHEANWVSKNFFSEAHLDKVSLRSSEEDDNETGNELDYDTSTDYDSFFELPYLSKDDVTNSLIPNSDTPSDGGGWYYIKRNKHIEANKEKGDILTNNVVGIFEKSYLNSEIGYVTSERMLAVVNGSKSKNYDAYDRTPLTDTAIHVMPRAVVSSEAFINYFFRGQLEATLDTVNDKIIIKNTSDAQWVSSADLCTFKNGMRVNVYYIDKDGVSKELFPDDIIKLDEDIEIGQEYILDDVNEALDKITDWGSKKEIIVLLEGTLGAKRGLDKYGLNARGLVVGYVKPSNIKIVNPFNSNPYIFPDYLAGENIRLDPSDNITLDEKSVAWKIYNKVTNELVYVQDKEHLAYENESNDGLIFIPSEEGSYLVKLFIDDILSDSITINVEKSLTKPTTITYERINELQVRVSWNSVENSDGYVVSIGNNQGDKITDTFVILDVDIDKEYEVRIQSYRGNIESERSETLLISPSAPNNFTGVLNDDYEIELSWDSLSNVKSYSICYDSETFNNFEDCSVGNGVIINGITESTKIINNLDSDLTYYFRIKAILNTDIETATSEIINVSTTKPVLQAPIGLTAIQKENTVILEWNPLTSTSSYKICMDLCEEDELIYVDTNKSIITELVRGQSYDFKVAGVKSTYKTLWSDIVTVKINTLPITNAGRDQTVFYQEETILSASASSDSDGSIKSYEWKENGVTLGREENLTYSSSTIGEHTLTLTIIDNNGGINTDEIKVIIDPLPIITLTNVETIEQGEIAYFEAVLSERLPLGYDVKISLGDGGGGYLNPVSINLSSSDFVTYDYNKTINSTGDRIYRVAIFNNQNLKISDWEEDTYLVEEVAIVKPVANAGADQNITYQEDAYLIGSGSTDSDGQIVSFEWKDGANVLGDEENVSINTLEIGEHNITLTVIDDDSNSDTDDVIVRVFESGTLPDSNVTAILIINKIYIDSKEWYTTGNGRVRKAISEWKLLEPLNQTATFKIDMNGFGQDITVEAGQTSGTIESFEKVFSYTVFTDTIVTTVKESSNNIVICENYKDLTLNDTTLGASVDFDGDTSNCVLPDNDTPQEPTGSYDKERYIVKDKAIIDKNTKLMWEDVVENTSLRKYNLGTTQIGNYCRGATTGGFSNWGVPSITQLQSLVETEKGNDNSYISDYFRHKVADDYWSHTGYFIDTDNSSYVQGVNFATGAWRILAFSEPVGGLGVYRHQPKHYGRCVRGVSDEELFTSTSIVHNNITYKTVLSPNTGRVWLDRNLGASQVCSSFDDSQCYGDYYQWGRGTDGHEKKNSNTIAVLNENILNTDSKFVVTVGGNHGDWTLGDFDGRLRQNQWNRIDNNSVCPTGYRVPSKTELLVENIDINSKKTAFSSFLKLSASGARTTDADNSYLMEQGFGVALWSNTIYTSGSESFSWDISFNGAMGCSHTRNCGLPVRCIKEN